jgi:hypothetical protein
LNYRVTRNFSRVRVARNLAVAGLCLLGRTGHAGGGFSEAASAAASLISAATEPAIAAIEADAAKSTSRTSSETAIATTQIASDTTKYHADLTAQTSFAEIAATLEINGMNQAGTTERQKMILDASLDATRDSSQLAREKMFMEYDLGFQRIELAKWMHQLDLRHRLIKAGLSPGTFPLASSAASVAPVNRVLSAEVSGSFGRGASAAVKALRTTQRDSRMRPSTRAATDRVRLPGALRAQSESLSPFRNTHALRAQED